MGRETVWSEIRAGVLTCSDSCFYRGLSDDSGQWLREVLAAQGSSVICYAVVPDEEDRIAATLLDWVDRQGCDLILTTGGTGLGPRDVTPEATARVIQRAAPSLLEYARWQTGQANPLAYLSRGVAGVRGHCLIVNFPGNVKAVQEYWHVLKPLLEHGLALLKGYRLHPRSPT
ncbi:Molybdopterin adenylyltransferase [bacterium HR11]|nr:Molybdopterin adenylyltransferase [bacterium HR11]